MSHENLTEKTCSRCRESKPVSEFKQGKAWPDGLYPYCRPCAAAYMREYRAREPERFRQYERDRLERHGDKRREQDRQRWATGKGERDRVTRRRFAYKIRQRYGITLEEYDELVSNPCGICGRTENIVLDHCHATGEIRGPLCRGCNSALGVFGDDPARLRAAANYIEQHRGGDAE